VVPWSRSAFDESAHVPDFGGRVTDVLTRRAVLTRDARSRVATVYIFHWRLVTRVTRVTRHRQSASICTTLACSRPRGSTLDVWSRDE
jgi:hypothetical protein